jgi:hypothetical protein
MKKTNSSTNGTSFHNVTIKTSVNKLKSVLGEPEFEDNTGEEKVNFEWDLETSEGDVVSLYDWKQYREIDEDEIIEFHIGAHSKSVSNVAFNELKALLNK